MKYLNQEVLPLLEVAEMLAGNETTTKKVYNNIKKTRSTYSERFVEGKDYFNLTKSQATEMYEDSKGYQNSPLKISNYGMQVWTQSGIAMLGKSIMTSFAWDLQRVIVDGFFGNVADSNAEQTVKDVVSERVNKIVTAFKIDYKRETEKEMQQLIAGRDNAEQTAERTIAAMKALLG